MSLSIFAFWTNVSPHDVFSARRLLRSSSAPPIRVGRQNAPKFIQQESPTNNCFLGVFDVIIIRTCFCTCLSLPPRDCSVVQSQHGQLTPSSDRLLQLMDLMLQLQEILEDIFLRTFNNRIPGNLQCRVLYTGQKEGNHGTVSSEKNV